ncbi:MAG: hypothetical protein UY92_C0004G0035 [Candidatus Magasanikbacteria bacterium GW2011_GWA2_56_11]|uniref:Uncharacterized protein n=1 Tax=Candidatus Magasanikbacteria bacterium GW2011_GWA2_56_11 TaxID=1619044 RepID=A0A0G2BB15_9BACT|nr:MAG: hypothetical protein UY92_C0004G0035 [Candidatus Magasanikbacteria bacterium GW2011_GWA2_56_11]
MPPKTKAKDSVNLTRTLGRLQEIAEWFDAQEEVDIEEGLEKVKEAAVLIKAGRRRLTEVKNEFEAVKKEMGTEETAVISPEAEEMTF